MPDLVRVRPGMESPAVQQVPAATNDLAPAPRRVLIVRLGAIGDVVHGLPVLAALRRAWPAARLGWVVEPAGAKLLAGVSALDERIIVPRGWYRSPTGMWRARSAVRGFGADVAIDLQGLTKSALLAWFSGAKRRIGFDGTDGRELSRWLNNVRVTATARHVVDRNLELLGPMGGGSNGPVEFPLAREVEAERFAAEYATRAGSGRPIAVINPGAGWASKRWPAERFTAVARHLVERGLCPIVVWGNVAEWHAAVEIAGAADVLLAPATSLAQLTSLVRRAALCVSGDTGPLHLAAAVGTPCAAVFGPSSAERNGPYGSGHVAVQAERFDAADRRRRKSRADLIESIPAESLIEACDRILAGRDRRAA
jgi:lipopolysaccharide heptosyltransferase I